MKKTNEKWGRSQEDEKGVEEEPKRTENKARTDVTREKGGGGKWRKDTLNAVPPVLHRIIRHSDIRKSVEEKDCTVPCHIRLIDVGKPVEEKDCTVPCHIRPIDVAKPVEEKDCAQPHVSAKEEEEQAW